MVEADTVREVAVNTCVDTEDYRSVICAILDQRTQEESREHLLCLERYLTKLIGGAGAVPTPGQFVFFRERWWRRSPQTPEEVWEDHRAEMVGKTVVMIADYLDVPMAAYERALAARVAGAQHIFVFTANPRYALEFNLLNVEGQQFRVMPTHDGPGSLAA